jgi:pantoate--beta-alanine ligase
MIICKDRAALAQQIQNLKSNGQRIAFVPTMGALHDGHLGLVDIANQRADAVVVSIFVNPTQFAPHEDFDAYPRDIERDCAALEEAGAHIVYLPREADIYPEGAQLYVKAGAAADGLESDFRPHFFHGVATVVSHLFTQIQPDVAVFGEKDFQQLQVIEEMVIRDKLDLEIVGVKIIRDEFGLALSSRNAYLGEGELEIARMLNQVVYKAAFDVAQDMSEDEATDFAKAVLLTCGFDKVDYVSVWKGRVLAAVWLGKTRLIDNAPIDGPWG